MPAPTPPADENTPAPSLGVGRELANLRVPARPELIPAIAVFVNEIAQAHGFSTMEASGLQLGTEELCSNVVTHAYEGDPTATYTVQVVLEAECLVVAVEDQGVPFDPHAMPSEGKLGTTLARAFADDLRFVYRGRQGKRVELRKNRVFERFIAPPAPEGAHPPIPTDEHLDIRLMRPEDAPELARCVWRVFGYSYPADELYEPEGIAERLRTGAWQCGVAARANGEIVGHIALIFNSPTTRVPESDHAIVAPYARGHRLMERLKSFLAEHARARGLAGIFSEAVAAHVLSQKVNLHLGAVETGVMLGYLPKSLVFKQVELAPAVLAAPRVSAVIYFLPLVAGAPRVVYVPARHAEIVRQIYQHAGLVRAFDSDYDDTPPLSPPEFSLSESTDWGAGNIVAEKYGADWRDHLRAHLAAFGRRGLAYVDLDLPLADPFTPTACTEAESLGFFFCGLTPDKLPSGDGLRLQAWINFTVAPESVQTASEFGAKLRDYAAQCARERPAT
jgi:anti-sigma regulatory factor (Ser/Thr protein kinase)